MAHALKLSIALDGPSLSAQIKMAMAEIEAERQRQIDEEGWSKVSDDRYTNGELMAAAECYALPSNVVAMYPVNRPPPQWPWLAWWWKPHGRRRNLVRAGALLLAEVERRGRRWAERQLARGLETGDLCAPEAPLPRFMIMDCEDRLTRIVLRLVDVTACFSIASSDEADTTGIEISTDPPDELGEART